MHPNQARAAKALLNKIKRQDPAFYRFFKRSGGNTLNGTDSIFDRLTNAAQSFYNLRDEKDLMLLEIKRAKEGLPPTPAPLMASTPQAPATAKAPMLTGEDTKKILLPVIGAGIAFLLFKRK